MPLDGEMRYAAEKMSRSSAVCSDEEHEEEKGKEDEYDIEERWNDEKIEEWRRRDEDEDKRMRQRARGGGEGKEGRKERRIPMTAPSTFACTADRAD